MKPIHKFNGGKGATLCNECSVIITEGLTDDLYCEEHGGEKKYKYVLTRARDGKIIKGNIIKWIEWDENKRFKLAHNEPTLNCSLVVDPGPFGQYYWLTTVVTKILDVKENVIKFTTLNSEYELLINK